MIAPAMTAERALEVLDQAAATLEWHERYRDAEGVQKARAFFAAMVERTTWRPIETAPKDGTFILAVVKGFAPAVAQWTTDFRTQGAFEFMEPGMFAKESHWLAVLNQTDQWEPTHWMPLPADPEPQP